jgi:cytochrome c-type biogenesis protein CcmH/NrfG
MGRWADEFRAGRESARIKSYGDAVRRAILVGVAGVIAWASPVSLGVKVLVFIGVMLVIGVVVRPMTAQDRSFIHAQINRWQQDLARNPKDYATLVDIAAAYGKLGEHDSAVTYCRRAIELNPAYADAYLLLGSAYGFLGRTSEATAALRKAVSLDPKNPYARGHLGSTLGRAGQYREAVTELKEAVRLKPDLADAHFALGLAYLSLRERREAVAEVEALSRIDAKLARQLQALLDGVR